MPEQLRAFANAGLDLLFLPDGAILAEPAADYEAPQQCPTTEAAPAIPTAELVQDTWPAPWSVLSARIRTPPRVIITYASLADDVAGAADPARRKLFQTILAYLAWPQGTTLFWPISFPSGVDPGPHFAVDIFASGVRRFDVRHVICFGVRPAERALTLFPQEGKTPSVLVHRAPEPEALITLLPHELHQALAFLKSITLS
ncbi:MAG: hypothetical protein P4L39_01155 [Humidesulfovibrio sp.]|nr:hypothetical protein [Humidesulfovibrio sp.]